MAAIGIPIIRPVDGPSRFSQQVTLDGTTYTLEFRWNVRAARTDANGDVQTGAWFMDILTAEGDQPLMLGIQIVVGYPLNIHITERTPGGVFLATDTSQSSTPGFGGGVDPGYDDLGNRVKLDYIS